jgi:hypothetical protein
MSAVAMAACGRVRERIAKWPQERLNTLDGYTDRMSKPESIAQAGLVGWRKAIADSVAPRAASRAPISEERLRAAIGAAFFLLSLYYVASTIARMIKSAPS